ncbi:BQ5605_C008g05293 [Microbotryum silenes-dioicae]|uniref:BQ5605_C008g05293 protein n=1 Tax=Microbotryum silenes-dioicae TaxID=796604 RepID=A0A2X0MD01_9BASI|nr:BQ5605_C008g05293 [Microbotryum silenes-dioicae]
MQHQSHSPCLDDFLQCLHVVVSAGDPHRAFTELVGYKNWFQLTLRERDFRERLMVTGRGMVNVKIGVGNGPLDR